MSGKASDWAGNYQESGPMGDGARVVLVALAEWANPDGSNVFPSKATIAKRTGKSERTIQRHLRELRELGLIVEGDQRLVAHIRSDRRPVVYNLLVGKRGVIPVSPSRGDNPDSSEDAHGETDRASSPSTGRQNAYERGDKDGTSGESDLSPNQNYLPELLTPSCAPDGARAEDAHKAEPAHDGFDEFWAAYPRTNDKARARKAYAKAMKATDQQTLLLALTVQMRTVFHGRAKDKVPYAATWLNGEPWNDDDVLAALERGNVIDHPTRGRDLPFNAATGTYGRPQRMWAGKPMPEGWQ